MRRVKASARSPLDCHIRTVRLEEDGMNETSVPLLRKTFKEKLRPTPAQEAALGVVLWRCRTLYNTALEQRIARYRQRGVSVSRYTQEAELKDFRASSPDYAAIHSHVLQDVLARLDRTYQAFFRRVQRGEQAGFPRYKGRNRYHSFTFKEYGNGARLDNGFLVLATRGRIAVHWSRPLEGTPKTVTVSQEADGWYVAISCAEVPAQPLPATGQETGRETGIDVGLKVFLITAEGAAIDTPRHSRRAERYLVKCARRVSKRKKGSHRRRKAVGILAKAHQHVRRQRADLHHKTALALVRAYDTVYVEALQPANLSRRPEPTPDSTGNGGFEHTGASRKAGLNKSIQDAGWRQFLTILACTGACAGKRVEAVCPAYTTQECSGCGERIYKSLRVRTHACPTCGLILDRDEHAAKNIQWRGQRLRGLVA
jgi:putative transposase